MSKVDLDGQWVAVLGGGRSGMAAARLAVRLGAREVTIYDSAEVSRVVAERGVEVEEGCAGFELGNRGWPDLVVTSPGIDGKSEFTRSFLRGGTPLIGELEFAWRIYDGTVVAITGTNGKTTTTELVREAVRAGGRSCVAAGNYGVPLAEVVLADEVPEVVALEVSSFQLETIVDFHPEVVGWMNFAPDHMDRYQKVEEYWEAKARVFENLERGDLVVARLGERLPSCLKEKGVEVVSFEGFGGETDWEMRNGWICRKGESVLALEETRLRGRHNAENLMAALAMVEGLGLERNAVLEALKKYRPLAHRCEWVRTVGEVEFLNDSKATNLHALEMAVRSQMRPLVLIVGGKNKGLDYRPMIKVLEEQRVKAVVCLGEIGEDLATLFEGVVPVEIAVDMGDAVQRAAGLAEAGDAVLLSPGTSSFDMFSGYEERGEKFRLEVERL